MKHPEPFRGIFTIPSTPFQPDGEIDVPSFRRVVDFCVECGAHGLVFPVNASEFSLLSDAERMTLSEVLVEQNNGRVPVVIGVAGVSREVAAMFARHARKIGADSVIAMPPYVKRGEPSQKVVYDYYAAISDAAQLPIWIQNYVPPIGTDLPVDFMIKLCRQIEYVKYIKEETVPSTVKISAIKTQGAGIVKAIMGGSGGRYLIEEYRRGVDGQMPGCHLTDVEVAWWQALEAGDEKRAMFIYKEMAPMFFFETQLPGTYKEVLYRRGVIDCPLRRGGGAPLDEVASQYLTDILKALAPLMTWGK
jgi:4-hydroxy-tetrahydrodipicolinate synthase